MAWSTHERWIASDAHQLQSTKIDGFRERLSRSRTSDLPDGQKNRRARKPVQPSREKYSASPNTQIKLITIAVSSPTRGAYRDRHGRWDGMRWTRRCGARLMG